MVGMQLMCGAEETDFSPMAIDVLEQSNGDKLLLCATQTSDDNRNIHVLRLNSRIGLADGLLSTRTRIPLPPDGQPKKRLLNTATLHGHVRSLAQWTKDDPSYADCCMATYGSLLLEYNVTRGEDSKPLRAPLDLPADITAISLLEGYRQIALVGLRNGQVYRHDSRSHQGASFIKAGNIVTGVHQIQNFIVTSTKDGTVSLYDIRQHGRSLHQWPRLPTEIVLSALEPGVENRALGVRTGKELLAVASADRRIRLVDLKESMKDAEPLLITPDPLQWPINSLTWTVDTREIVAATGSHIQMFRLLGL